MAFLLGVCIRAFFHKKLLYKKMVRGAQKIYETFSTNEKSLISNRKFYKWISKERVEKTNFHLHVLHTINVRHKYNCTKQSNSVHIRELAF